MFVLARVRLYLYIKLRTVSLLLENLRMKEQHTERRSANEQRREASSRESRGALLFACALISWSFEFWTRISAFSKNILQALPHLCEVLVSYMDSTLIISAIRMAERSRAPDSRLFTFPAHNGSGRSGLRMEAWVRIPLLTMVVFFHCMFFSFYFFISLLARW